MQGPVACFVTAQLCVEGKMPHNCYRCQENAQYIRMIIMWGAHMLCGVLATALATAVKPCPPSTSAASALRAHPRACKSVTYEKHAVHSLISEVVQPVRAS